MKQLQSERVFLNMAGKESSQTVRLTLHLQDDVDGAVLVTAGRQQVALLSEAANHHLLAFAWWDDCIALDWFYPLTDGTGAYCILRTLLYEYCRRRYDSTLNSAGIPVTGDDISEEETVDPLTLPRPDSIRPQPVPDKPKALNLFTDAVVPLREDEREVIHIRVSEHELMERVRSLGATPCQSVRCAAVASRQPSASGLLQRCSHHLLSSQSPQGYRHTIGTPADGWFGYNPIP